MKTLFLQTYKLNSALLSNSIIYRLRKLPLVKHIVPGELYGNEAISAFIFVLTALFTIGKELLGKALFLGILIFAAHFSPTYLSENLLVIYFAFTLTFSFVSNQYLQASKEKYYAIQLMRIDANEYCVMDFTMTSLINMASMFIVLLIFTFIFSLPIYYCIAFPIFQLIIKTMSTSLWLTYYEHHKKVLIDLWYVQAIVMIIGILLAMSGVNQQIYLPDIIFILICTIGSILGYCFYQNILKTKTFKSYFKKKLTLNTVIFDAESVANITKNNIKKQLSYDRDIHSDKKGYDFFNDLFFQRHKKILMNSAIRFAGIFGAIFLVLIGVLWFMPETRLQAALTLETHLASFLMIMYFTNRGAKVTMAMFVNCDSSMLTYRFYRQPKSLLNLFTQRLKTLLIVNLLPSLVISLGLIIALYISDASTPYLNYALIFIMINAMSIFFSVHYLILYYLLQPYNINLQAKGYLYNIISSITYLVCYYMINARFALFPFTISVIVFCVLYILISLYLVYKMAPRTFHLKN